MKAKIANYKGGVHTQYADRMILVPEGVTRQRAGKKNWSEKKSHGLRRGGNKINGVVSKAHGRNGSILAKFEKGLPGQALGTEVDIF